MNRRDFTKSGLLSIAALPLPLPFSTSAKEKNSIRFPEDTFGMVKQIILTHKVVSDVNGGATIYHQNVLCCAGIILDKQNYKDYFDFAKDRIFELKMLVCGQLKTVGRIESILSGNGDVITGKTIGFDAKGISYIGVKPALLGKNEIAYYLVTEVEPLK